MDADLAALPDDTNARKAALTIARAKTLQVVAQRDAGAAELAVARARASEDLALIAHQKLRIAKVERQIYGPRSEPSRRPRRGRASPANGPNETASPNISHASAW